MKSYTEWEYERDNLYLSDNENKSTETEQNKGNIDKNSEKEVWKWVKWEENIWKSKIWGGYFICVYYKGGSAGRGEDSPLFFH